MEIKKKTKELSDQLLEKVFDETKKCIKHAETHEDRLRVRSLLNAFASYYGTLEDYYKHPQDIDEILYQ